MKGSTIGSIIGAGVGLVGTGINALIGAAKERARRRALAKRERENQLWYDRRYNEVGRERGDAQRLLTKMREAQRDRMDRVAGRQAVMGGSSAVRASEQESANKALGDTVSQIDAAQESRRDKIEQQYLSRKDAISNARDKLDLAHQTNLANAATQASAIGAQLAASAVGGGGKSGESSDASVASSSSDGGGAVANAESRSSARRNAYVADGIGGALEALTPEERETYYSAWS